MYRDSVSSSWSLILATHDVMDSGQDPGVLLGHRDGEGEEEEDQEEGDQAEGARDDVHLGL